MRDFNKKKLPFLAGEGPQRTPIRVKVRHYQCSNNVKNAIIIINRLDHSLLIQCIWLLKLKHMTIMNML